MTIDLLKGGAEQSVLSTLTAGSSYEQTDITNTNFATTDTFGLKIKQIGSTVAGADLTVVVHYVKQTSGDSANYLAIPYEGTAVDEDTVFEGFYFDAAVTIAEVDIAARTAPTGANLTVDLLKDGSEESRTMTLADGSTYQETDISDDSYATTERLGLRIKSVGSTTAGQSVLTVLHTSQGQVGSALNLDWEYWDGDSWADLESISGFTDNTGAFTQDGAVYWTANPTNWRPYSMNGSTDLYYTRTPLNASSEAAYSTSPVENFIKTDILILQYLANVTSADQTWVVVPEGVLVFLLFVPVLPVLAGKRKKKRRGAKIGINS